MNKKIHIRIDEVVGSDYSILSIENHTDDRFPDERFMAYLPTLLACDLAELLMSRSKHREVGTSEYLRMFVNNKIDDCEYINEYINKSDNKNEKE